MSAPRFHRVLLLPAFLLCVLLPSVATQNVDIWLGTSRSKLSKGIYHCVLDEKRGTLSDPVLAAEIEAPGFLAKHPRLEVLYAVGVLGRIPVVAAYSIERSPESAGPKLALLSSQPIGDGRSAHLAVSKDGRFLLTAQYGGGSIAAFKLANDGKVLERYALIEHEGGSNVVARRQKSPHPHWVGFSPDGRFVFVPDLGLDTVVIYAFDPKTGRLTAHGEASVPPGGGPRHMKFHPSGKYAYVLCELSLAVRVFDYDAATGKMTKKQDLRTLTDAEQSRESFHSASEIRVHASGDFVYTANRGHDSISAFKVDPSSGELKRVDNQPCRGATPRNFNLAPSGNWLLAAGQHSHTLALFAIDAKSGQLTYQHKVVFAPSAICVLPVARR